MNKYLIAALYVMAGCAVAIPSKVQGSPETLSKERCRLIITNSAKVVSIYLEEENTKQLSNVLTPDFFHLSRLIVDVFDFSEEKSVDPGVGPLCLTSHRIRAPGEFLI